MRDSCVVPVIRGDFGGVECFGGEFVLEGPEDSHGAIAGVADVGCWSGVKVWGAPRSTSGSLLSRKERCTVQFSLAWLM
jgi:hypothetical protein